jgi:hypothetical protein
MVVLGGERTVSRLRVLKQAPSFLNLIVTAFSYGNNRTALINDATC